MGHKSFAIALVMGLLALPLACGSDDDTNPGTGGAGGSSGKAGGAGKGGAGAGGKDGTAGKGGAPGGAGEGGTGDTGNVGGEPGAGAGGDSAPSAGAGPDGSGAGGEAGGGSDPAAERLAQCKAICNYPAQPDGPGGSETPMQCLGDANKCATDFCNTTGWSATCVKALDDLLACLPTATKNMFYCGDGEHGLEGTLQFDGAASDSCLATFTAWTNCL